MRSRVEEYKLTQHLHLIREDEGVTENQLLLEQEENNRWTEGGDKHGIQENKEV